jgi:formate transporter
VNEDVRREVAAGPGTVGPGMAGSAVSSVAGGSGPALDALVPREMARRAEGIGVVKANLPTADTIALGVLAGAFIALGSMLSTIVTTGTGLSFGVARLLGGVVFSLGLALVVIGGAELFTGNNLIVMAFASHRISWRALLRNWVLVYVANFVGAIATAFLVFWSGQYRSGGGAVGRRALDIAQTKSSLTTREAIILGMLANALVCLAVWLCLAARSVTDKIMAVVFPVTAFVAAGFEHSIANMYFIPMGIFVRRWGSDGFWTAANTRSGDFPAVTWRRFFVSNLAPVTAGNIIGGAVMVGLVYWFVYLRPDTGGNRERGGSVPG